MKFEIGKCKRILIVKLSSIGDVVMTTPVAKALRRAIPDAYIAWVVEDKAKDMLIGNPYLDDIIIWNRRSTSSSLRERASGLLLGLARLGPVLRAGKFDLAIDFQGLLRSGVVTSLSGARYRVGYDSAREGAVVFYNVRLPSRELRVRGPQQYLNMLRVLNIFADDLDMYVPIGEGESAFARSFLAEAASINPGHEKVVSLCPATTWKQKHWMEDGWAHLADALVSEHNALPVFLGSMADCALVGRIRAMMKFGAGDATGKTDLKQAAAIMKQSDLTIAVDTGLMHTAIAVNCPTVGIFGPTRWRHLARKETFAAVVKEFPCMPCLRHPSCKQFDCMRAVTPEDVLTAARPWLTRKAD